MRDAMCFSADEAAGERGGKGGEGGEERRGGEEERRGEEEDEGSGNPPERRWRKNKPRKAYHLSIRDYITEKYGYTEKWGS